VLASAAVLLICLFYTYAIVFVVPYPGIGFDSRWVVRSVEPCKAGSECIQVGDQLVTIGGLTYDKFSRDRRRMLFDGYSSPGDIMPITLIRDGKELTVNWRMVGPTYASRLSRLSGSLFIYLPFWLAGTIVLLFLRPRNERWLLLILFNYITAIWLAAGVASSSQVAASSLVLHASVWLSVPIYLHLHLIVPSPFFKRHQRYLLLPLYAVSIVLALLEFWQVLPLSAFYLGFLLAIFGSLGLLLSRLRVKSLPSDRMAARLIIAGMGVAFVPSIVLWVIPQLSNSPLSGTLTGIAPVLVTPVLPLTYIYAIYKHRLEALEFRANRLLSLYSFLLLYLTAYVLVFLTGSRWFHSPDKLLTFSLVVSMVFVSAAPTLRTRFQRLVDQLAYGARHMPEEILRVFASQIPAAFNREALIRLLADEIAPSLLVRQSALYLLGDTQPELLYTRAVSPGEEREAAGKLYRLLVTAGRYRPPQTDVHNESDWVRLAIPLRVQERTIGIWLLGRRDPDDFYPQNDIDLLVTLANQIAPVIENARLYEQAQQEIAERIQAEEALRRSEQELRKLNVTLEERVRQRTAELQVLYELSQQIGYTFSYDELFRLLLTHLHRILPYDVAAALLVMDGSCELFIHSRRPLTPAVEQRVRDRLLNEYEQQNSQQVSREGLTVRTIEAANQDLSHQPLGRLGASSLVPLIVEGKAAGFLLVAAEEERRFSEDQERLLRTVASQASESVQRLHALLAAERRRLESLVEHLPEGVLLLDAEHRLVLVNPVARRYLPALTGATVGQVITTLGGHPLETMLASYAGRLAREIVLTGPPRQVFELRAQPVQRGPEEGGWLLLMRDVTQEREIQQRIQQRERLAAVGQLAAGIAHDFNNILQGIIGFAELLEQRPDIPDFARTRMEFIAQQGRRAAHLTRQILDFSRQSVVDKHPLDLVSFLKESIKLLEHTIPENIHIVLDVAPGEYTLNGDPAQLQQVLTNLAINARDAMPEGGELRFQLSRFTLRPNQRAPGLDMPPGEWIVLSVSDTGTGISPDALPHIFEPFFTTKGVGQGTGLGLAQVYGIVEQHEGYIDVKSQVGHGTTFTLYLPAWQTSQVDAAAPKPAVVGEGHGETILVVEDDPATREAVQDILEMLGYRVLAVSDGQAALKLFEQQGGAISLVLSDMVMPGMNGVQLYQALKARWSEIRMMIITGYLPEEEGERLLQQGVAAWVQKPFSVQQIAEKVQAVLAANGAF